MSVIGRIEELWQTKYTENAYTDQMGIKHHAYVVLKKVIVEIVEVRDVKGDWGGTIVPAGGWRAQDKEGNSYYNNWNSFDDASMSPRYIWWSDKEHWHVAQRTSWIGTPYINLDQTRAAPSLTPFAKLFPPDYQI